MSIEILVNYNSVIAGLSFLAPILMAFTPRQTEAIRERDYNLCQFPENHDCDGNFGLEVHHIVPQQKCKSNGRDADVPTNGISICSSSHHSLHDGRRWKQFVSKLQKIAENNTASAIARGWEFPKR